MNSQPDEPLPIDKALSPLRKVLDRIWAELALSSEGPQRILFVSPGHDTGTTTLAAWTALGLARNTGERVALVELNGFSPALASYIDIAPTPGVVDVIDGRVGVEDALKNARVSGLDVLTGHGERPMREHDFNPKKIRGLLDQVSQGHQFTIIDGPPLLEHQGARLLLPLVDGAVLVLRSGETRKHDAQNAVEILEQAGVPILGTVLNRFRSDMPFRIGSRKWLG